MIDTFQHKGLRKQLLQELERKGIHDSTVLEAMWQVPRHWFTESYLQNMVYKDRALPIGAGQTISQPYTVAYQSQLLEVKKGDKILEIGTGSGYQTAILVEMGAKVYTIERQKELYLKSQTLLRKLGFKAQFFFDDGNLGKPAYGPFDKILITAATKHFPEALLAQLKIGGIMVAPVGGSDFQIMTKLTRISQKEFTQKKFGEFRFVPMLEGLAR